VSCEDGEDLRALPRTIDPLKTLICVNLPPIRVELGFCLMRDTETVMDGWIYWSSNNDIMSGRKEKKREENAANIV
jgi:hypothetical protein